MPHGLSWLYFIKLNVANVGGVQLFYILFYDQIFKSIFISFIICNLLFLVFGVLGKCDNVNASLGTGAVNQKYFSRDFNQTNLC